MRVVSENLLVLDDDLHVRPPYTSCRAHMLWIAGVYDQAVATDHTTHLPADCNSGHIGIQ